MTDFLHPVCYRPALFLAVMCLAAGCGKVYSVRRTVQIRQVPPPEMLVVSIQQVPGIALTHVPRAPSDNHYGYRQGDFTGMLTVDPSDNTGCTLTFYSAWTDSAPSPGTVRQARSAMDDIYARLRLYNPNLPPASSMKEELSGLSTPAP